jgi:hypothetical protein
MLQNFIVKAIITDFDTFLFFFVNVLYSIKLQILILIFGWRDIAERGGWGRRQNLQSSVTTQSLSSLIRIKVTKNASLTLNEQGNKLLPL